MSKVEQLLDAEASAAADLDELHESKMDEATARIAAIINFTDERDPEIFELFGAAIEDEFLDYFAVSHLDRDPLWAASLAALSAAAGEQAWIELYAIDTLTLAEKNGRAIEAIRQTMTRSELIEAAHKGIGKARINGEKKRRKT